MHGILAMFILPVAAIVGWRWSTRSVQKMAGGAAAVLAIGFSSWFGGLAWHGTEIVETINQRLVHATGTIACSFQFPIVQLLIGAVLLWRWPKKWQYKGHTRN